MNRHIIKLSTYSFLCFLLNSSIYILFYFYFQYIIYSILSLLKYLYNIYSYIIMFIVDYSMDIYYIYMCFIG